MGEKAEGKRKRSTVVKIYGREYRIRSDEDEETVQRIARYVDGKMREVGKSVASADPVGVAVLTALNIAGEYLPGLDDREATAGMTAERIRKLIQIVDQSLIRTDPRQRAGRSRR
jgi:cell division protein ZapA (FtsZ GTPase activity inhibitor)